MKMKKKKVLQERSKIQKQEEIITKDVLNKKYVRILMAKTRD